MVLPRRPRGFAAVRVRRSRGPRRRRRKRTLRAPRTAVNANVCRRENTACMRTNARRCWPEGGVRRVARGCGAARPDRVMRSESVVALRCGGRGRRRGRREGAGGFVRAGRVRAGPIESAGNGTAVATEVGRWKRAAAPKLREGCAPGGPRPRRARSAVAETGRGPGAPGARRRWQRVYRCLRRAQPDPAPAGRVGIAREPDAPGHAHPDPFPLPRPTPRRTPRYAPCGSSRRARSSPRSRPSRRNARAAVGSPVRRKAISGARGGRARRRASSTRRSCRSSACGAAPRRTGWPARRSPPRR